MTSSNAVAQSFRMPNGIILRGIAAGPPNAPTVVLLHGGGQTRHSWSRELGLLVDAGYRVLAYDARGHGESDWAPEGDYSVPQLADDLNVILASLTGPVALVGASMGGMTSFYAVGSSPQPIAKALILVDIVPQTVAKGADRIVRFMTAHQNGFATLEEAVEAVAAYNPRRPRPQDPSGLMNNLRRRSDGRLYWHWDPRLLQARVPAEPPALRDHALAVAARVTVPTLLVRGGKSELIDDQGIDDFRTMLPHLEVFNVADAGHMVAGDDNSNFHEGIIGFLRRHLPAPGRDAAGGDD